MAQLEASTMEYDPATAAVVLARIADGESLRTICKADDLPSRETIRLWLLENTDFAGQYARAREEQADTYADEIAAIADERPPLVGDTNHQAGERASEDGNTRMDSAFVAWQRVRIDSRKWIASKLKPKKYADKIDHTLADADGGPVRIICSWAGVPSTVESK